MTTFRTAPLVPRPVPRTAKPPEPFDVAAPKTGRTARPVDVTAVRLLHLAQAGNRDAFAALYLRHVDRVRRYLTVRMRDHDSDAVPDLLQDTFLAALEDLHDAPDDVTGWLLQLAATMCTRHTWSQRRYHRAALTLRDAHRHPVDADALDRACDPGEAPLGEAPGAAVVAQALASLPDRERLTLQLRLLDGNTITATAQLLGCSRDTVRRTQHRALTHLTDALAPMPAPSVPPTRRR